MKIVLAKHAGFCAGVKNAVDMALKLAKEHGKIYTLGELVHNENVCKFLQSNGVKTLDSNEFDLLKAGDVALIRAHGIEKQTEDELKRRGVILFDATCKVVKKNQLLVEERVNAGDRIVIYGDEKHDEVIGLKSYAGNNFEVLKVGEFPKNTDENTSVVFQTTVLKENFEEIKEYFKKNEKNLLKSFDTFNTICYTTSVRQDEVRVLAKETDAVIVIGSKNSANTRRLFEVASEINGNTYFVTTLDDVRTYIKDIIKNQSVSIVAGASTPPWLISEVIKFMSDTQNNGVTPNDEVKETLHVAESNETLSSEAPKKVNEHLSQEELMKASNDYTTYKVGKRVNGTVISADDKGVYVNIGGKKDGFIDKSEATIDGNYNPAEFKKDDKIAAEIIDVKDCVYLSKKKVDVRRKEREESEKLIQQDEFPLLVVKASNKGVNGFVGPYEVFVPSSKLEIGRNYMKEEELKKYVGKTLRVVRIEDKSAKAAETAEGEGEVKRRKSNPNHIVASQRDVLEREKKKVDDEFWAKRFQNEIVNGTVKKIMPYGAFIDFDDETDPTHTHNGLVHQGELSWTRKFPKPETILTVGETYRFVILEFDRETSKIKLGYKQLQPTPYEVMTEKYPIDSVVEGSIQSIQTFGVFVTLGDGIDGLVHIRELANRFVQDPNKLFSVGQNVKALVIGYNEEKCRLTLSIRQLPENEVAESEGAAEADHELTDEEKEAQRSSRRKKFEQKVADSEGKKSKKESNEPKEWVSSTGNATLGDILKNMKLDLPTDEEEEVKPAKKTTRKKKTESSEEE